MFLCGTLHFSDFPCNASLQRCSGGCQSSSQSLERFYGGKIIQINICPNSVTCSTRLLRLAILDCGPKGWSHKFSKNIPMLSGLFALCHFMCPQLRAGSLVWEKPWLRAGDWLLFASQIQPWEASVLTFFMRAAVKWRLGDVWQHTPSLQLW